MNIIFYYCILFHWIFSSENIIFCYVNTNNFTKQIFVLFLLVKTISYYVVLHWLLNFWKILVCNLYIKNQFSKYVFVDIFLRCWTKIDCYDYVVSCWIIVFLKINYLCYVRIKILHETFFIKGTYKIRIFWFCWF